MKRRVAITGLGVVSAIGQSHREFWRSLLAGCSGIRPLEGIPPGSVRFPCAAQALDFRPQDRIGERTLPFLDRFAQMAVAAAKEAFETAAWSREFPAPARTAVIMGTSIGGQQTQDAGFEEIYAQKKPKIHPYTIPRIMPSSGASHITMELGFTGPAYTISTACSSASHAIGQAYWMVRHGQVEAALAGGSECPFSLGFLKAWDALRVVSPDTCRPFSRGRQGLILGEGAGCLAIETVESAQARGASIYAEITGFGMSSDAGHITQPSVEGAASAISAALQDGGIDPERIGYVNAHGTGTQLNDVVETRALRAALGPAADKCPVSSTKSLHGHALGAAGALEAVASVLALHCGELPATANYLAPDPECDLDVITGESRKAAVEMALSNSFAFGGLNAVLAFQKAG